ncbi:MAG: PhnD/SsuA/transferrin family substrate-binding protein [Actinobacteria bacterium]|nr:PhnD/SsuA/transferrin family substrate-binding protein [Actinomycetota bacterium]
MTKTAGSEERYPRIGRSRLGNLIHVALLLVMAMIVAGCGGAESEGDTAAEPEETAAAEEEEPEETEATQAELQKVTLRADWFLSAVHAPFFVAQDEGWYEEVGLEVEYGEGEGSSSTVQLVGAKRDDFGYATAEAVIRGIAEGADITYVANVLPQFGLCVAVLADSGIESAEDLVGKTIGNEADGTTTAMFEPYLKSAGIDPADVEQVFVDGQALLTGLPTGQFDAIGAIAYSEPAKMEAEFDIDVDCLRYSDHEADVMGHGIVVHNDTLRDNPEMVVGFVQATMRGFEALVDDPDTAINTIRSMVDDDSALPEQAVAVANMEDWSDLRDMPEVEGKPMGYIDEGLLQKTVDLLRKYKDLQWEGDLSDVYTNEFVED